MTRRTTTWLIVGACLIVGAAATLRAQEPERERVHRERRVRIHAPPTPTASGGWLGVRVEDIDASEAGEHGLEEPRGALVRGVEDASPAAEAGLAEGDVIVSFDGEDVRSVAELVRLVRETPAGRTVRLVALRDGDRSTLSVEIGERPGPAGFAFAAPSGDWEDFELRLDSVPGLSEERVAEIRARAEEAGERAREHMRRFEVSPGEGEVHLFRFLGRPRLGVELQSLTDQLAEYFGVGERGGVLVAAVREGSPAAEAGLRAGDVIVAFDGDAVADPGDLSRAVRRAEAGRIEVTVVRRGQERTLSVELPERERRPRGPEAMGARAPHPVRAAPPAPRVGAPPSAGVPGPVPALPAHRAVGRVIVL